ncbi:MAG: HIRAN domain-containing protein [Kiritimatiellae bacterium]|mgnify:CR=1 FL=1|nr:HIRAN domain-containing protein [Kiritimatiellia bacterium]
MANDLVIAKDDWLEVADALKDLPAPFRREIFLLECHVAGTTRVDDVEKKTGDLAEGDALTLRREPENASDPFAIAVHTAKNDRVGWVPQRKNVVISRLMDAGKLVYAKVASREIVEEDDWVDVRMKIYMRDV